MRTLSRRELLVGGVATLGGLSLPIRPLLANEGSRRRFLFIFASGGWDPMYCWWPTTRPDLYDGDPTGAEAVVGGIRHVGSSRRPSVRSFFERYGSLSAVLHGFEVRSISHDNCQRILLTGDSSTGGDDWGSRLASLGDGSYPAPFLVLSGPSYASARSAQVVRSGARGQLGALLDGTAREAALAPSADLRRWTSTQSELVDAVVAQRARTAAEANLRGSEGRWHRDYVQSLDRLSVLGENADALGAPGELAFAGKLEVAVDALAGGISRAVLVQHDGIQDIGWDTHGSNDTQSRHYEHLFEHLNGLMVQLASRRSVDGGVLLDDTVVVVLSEMGRTPRLNTKAGKDHWTYTSAMLVGAGVRGGQCVGGYDDQFFGQRIDPVTGALDGSGVALTAAHLGATLLRLGGVDPAAELPGIAPVDALVRA